MLMRIYSPCGPVLYQYNNKNMTWELKKTHPHAKVSYRFKKSYEEDTVFSNTPWSPFTLPPTQLVTTPKTLLVLPLAIKKNLVCFSLLSSPSLKSQSHMEDLGKKYSGQNQTVLVFCYPLLNRVKWSVLYTAHHFSSQC
jgi:hypothetical protein